MKSSFSGKEIPKGTGLMYVTKTGKVFYFANSKEYKNMIVLKRKARKTKWTAEFHELKSRGKSDKKWQQKEH